MTKARSASFSLPWPDKQLSPNARVHWAPLAKAKKTAKHTGYYTVQEAGIETINASSLSVRYVFYPPSHHRYDQDNVIASLKAYADGIAAAIGVDDSKWRISIAPSGPVEKGGRVKVELEWTE